MDRTESTALLQQARGGSDDALNRLFRRYGPKLLALIRVRMGSLRGRTESRDVLNVVLLKAFQRLEQFEGGDARALMGWLARIAENEIRDQADYHARERRDAAKLEGDGQLATLAARVRSQVSLVVLDEETARLERALAELDPDHREVILLRHFEELGFREIARRMGRSADACRMLLARAMTALTLKLREMA